MQKNSYDCVFLHEGKLEKVTLWIGKILSSGHLLAEGMNACSSQIKFHLKCTFYVMYMGIYLCTLCMPDALGGPKSTSDHLEQELEPIASHHVGTGN